MLIQFTHFSLSDFSWAVDSRDFGSQIGCFESYQLGLNFHHAVLCVSARSRWHLTAFVPGGDDSASEQGEVFLLKLREGGLVGSLELACRRWGSCPEVSHSRVSAAELL